MENSWSVTTARGRPIAEIRTLLGKRFFQGLYPVFEFRRVFAQVHLFRSGPQQSQEWKTSRLIFVSNRRKAFERQAKFVRFQKLIKLLQVGFTGRDNLWRE